VNGIRCFVGIPLPPCIADPIAEAVSVIRESDRSWRDEKWVPRENMHVTLKFLGNLAEDEVEALAEAIGDAVATHHTFDLWLADVRAVPHLRRCRMLWATFLDTDGACAALARSVDRAAQAFGVEPDERAFVPHATLCRARRPRSLSGSALDAARAILADVSTPMSVPSATVFSSRLTPRGPIYSPIGSRSLRGD
jgi:2'-5' RNA ligase